MVCAACKKPRARSVNFSISIVLSLSSEATGLPRPTQGSGKPNDAKIVTAPLSVQDPCAETPLAGGHQAIHQAIRAALASNGRDRAGGGAGKRFHACRDFLEIFTGERFFGQEQCRALLQERQIVA